VNILNNWESTKPRTLAGTAAGGGVWLWGRFAPKS